MGLLNTLLGKDSRGPAGLKPIVQRAPMPVVSARPAAAVAVVKAPPAPVLVTPPPAAIAIRPAPEPAPVPKVEVPPPALVEPAKPKPPPLPAAPATRIDAPKPEPPRRNEDLAHLRRGIVLQARADHAGAIEEFTKAIELDPACVEAWSGRGISREALGDVDEARRDYCKSIEIEVRAEIDRQLRSAA